MATAIFPAALGVPALDQSAAALASRLASSVVEVRVRERGMGSGIIWGPDGLIVTNAHVVRGSEIDVELADGAVLPAQVTARDEVHDLATLQVAAGNLPAAVIGDSDALRVGQLVLAMGNPLGLTRALSMGIIHAMGGGEGARWIQADIRLAPGNSGGPLVDAEGRVVGVNSMVAGGLALAVPSTMVRRFLAGETRPAYLGVQTQLVAVPGSESGRGLMVLEVLKGGPAARGGLLPGDILLNAGRTALREPDDLLRALGDLSPGTPLPLTILRAGSGREVTIVLGERPPEGRS
ncbi:MAG: S1C family serine protease [Chloroflexota bacterium]